MRGRFISLEGPEGAGKSTLIRALGQAFEQDLKSTLLTREPGGSPIGGAVRDLLLHSQHGLSPLAELFLFLADRTEHVTHVIRPALAEEKVVLCDRHADSTVVYQGHARGMDVDWLRELNLKATHGLRPDLILLLDVDPKIGLERQLIADRLGGMPLEFHEKVRAGFLAEAHREPGKWEIIDASRSSDDVAKDAIDRLKSRGFLSDDIS